MTYKELKGRLFLLRRSASFSRRGAIHSLMDERRVRSLSNQRRQRQRREAELAAMATMTSAAADLCPSADDDAKERSTTSQRQQLTEKSGATHAQYSHRRLSFTASPPAYRRHEPRSAQPLLIANVAETRRRMANKQMRSGPR